MNNPDILSEIFKFMDISTISLLERTNKTWCKTIKYYLKSQYDRKMNYITFLFDRGDYEQLSQLLYKLLLHEHQYRIRSFMLTLLYYCLISLRGNKANTEFNTKGLLYVLNMFIVNRARRVLPFDQVNDRSAIERVIRGGYELGITNPDEMFFYFGETVYWVHSALEYCRDNSSDSLKKLDEEIDEKLLPLYRHKCTKNSNLMVTNDGPGTNLICSSVMFHCKKMLNVIRVLISDLKAITFLRTK